MPEGGWIGFDPWLHSVAEIERTRGALAGDALVKGAVNLSLRLGVPALIVSLTIVAFGTSAPELLISVKAVLADGDFFGEFSFLTGRPRSATVETITSALILEIDQNVAEKVLHLARLARFRNNFV